MVHGIIRRHAGEIDVTSKPGDGSTFRIFLPRDNAAAPAARPAVAGDVAPAAHPAGGG